MGNVKLDMGRLQAIVSHVGPETDRILERSARRIEAGSKLRSPVDTGTNRNSITVEKPEENVRKIGPTTDYGIFIELGTSSTPAQPFMLPAFEEERDQLIADLKKLV